MKPLAKIATKYNLEKTLGYTNKDGSPRKCLWCHSKKFTEEVRDEISGHACEIAVHCASCKRLNGYWAYGYYENGHDSVFDRVSRMKSFMKSLRENQIQW